jgi:AcrR family transcriptional regulator
VTLSEQTPQRRQYNSPLRRQRAAETRERIISAGADLLHGFPTWNWRALTVGAVAKRAGVNQRTVYRYFRNERELRDAVLGRFEQEAGIDLEGLGLETLEKVATRIFEYVESFPIEPRTPTDPTVAAANKRQREALLAAVAPSTMEWSAADRTMAAAMFDVLWSVVSYEHLVVNWELAPKDAIRAITWVMGLVQEALLRGSPPTNG